ncbi:VOC family protein [Pseudomarimonas salicorniae]|uniref:VOC family protein n=1 Tax=Pseudomarimonas salicorniae TaxID=2933270 RepID=A0ABT0GI55_9GAMM|nr:VOC family protein [Lysobacter sp. CAU 1642]MCK7594234.1 VOC family protein [Lysobacter sp. CAU 1642]
MGTMGSHANGSPAWFELATTDQTGAKAFYQALMGWSHQDHPISDDQHYTIFEGDGAEVAAAYTMMPEQAESGMPPHWDIYFQVADVDASVEKARALGGQVVVEPAEVMEHLRMAVLSDPQGALFCLMQPRQHTGVGKLRQPHSVTWVELATSDLDAARSFYGELLGWTLTEHPGAPVAYRIVETADGRVGGLMQMTEEWGDIPPHWSIYLQTPDIQSSVATATAQGAKLNVPIFPAPGVGQIAQLSDPSGAWFYLIQPEAAAG